MMTKINYKRTGGVMGQEMAVDFDLNEMPDATAQRVHNLILESEFFKTPVQNNVMSGPDEFEYTVTIDRANVIHSVHTTDTSMPDSLRPLIEELTELAKAAEK